MKRISLSLISIGVFGVGAAGQVFAQAHTDAKPAMLSLSGTNEVPVVTTSAAGESSITVADDMTVTGGVKTSGVAATASHIHEGAAGANGPVILPLIKGTDGSFSVPAGSKLTDKQYESYKAGHLYVNVHSAAHPGGEIRAQLLPK